MLKIVLYVAGGVLALALVVAAAWAITSFSSDDADDLAARLANLEYPEEFILVDQWAYDGSYKTGAARAARVYLYAGAVDEACELIDAFYRDMNLRPMSRSDNPDDWCGRSTGGSISIDAETNRLVSQVPPELAGADVTRITYRAS